MFKEGFEKTAATKLPKLLTHAHKTMNVKVPGFSIKGIKGLLRRRK